MEAAVLREPRRPSRGSSSHAGPPGVVEVIRRTRPSVSRAGICRASATTSSGSMSQGGRCLPAARPLMEPRRVRCGWRSCKVMSGRPFESQRGLHGCAEHVSSRPGTPRVHTRAPASWVRCTQRTGIEYRGPVGDRGGSPGEQGSPDRTWWRCGRAERSGGAVGRCAPRGVPVGRGPMPPPGGDPGRQPRLPEGGPAPILA